MSLLFVRVGVLGICALTMATGCGLRSDPLFSGDTDLRVDSDTEEPDTDPTQNSSEGSLGSADSGDFPPPEEGRLGSCTNPILLPGTDASADGSLRGPGLYTGVCGEASGLEDVYMFAPSVATDVTLVFDAARTSFDPIVRVQENGCPSNEGLLRTCTNDWFNDGVGDRRHFLAFGGREYFIHVDSDEGGGGEYAFDLVLGPPATAECEIHPEVIFQERGSVFRWENDFPGGQGVADSQCGGVGRENFFQLQMFEPGTVAVNVSGFNGFAPVVSVRSDCGALTEVECASELLAGTPGFAFVAVFLEAGTYYISVDNLNLLSGSYALDVIFD